MGNSQIARTALAVLILLSTLLSSGKTALAAPLNWAPDDGCKPGLSNDGYFYAGGPSQYWGVYSGGVNNCHLETWNIQNTIISTAEWYLPIDTRYNGTYGINAYVKSTATNLTHQADYRSYRDGHAGGITYNAVLDQNANRGGFCYHLANITLNGSNGGLEDLIDYTPNEATNTKKIYVDQFCFIGV